jgi:hypothetical protein
VVLSTPLPGTIAQPVGTLVSISCAIVHNVQRIKKTPGMMHLAELKWKDLYFIRKYLFILLVL